MADSLRHDYFKGLLTEIREIRASERRFYQKITDLCEYGIFRKIQDQNYVSGFDKEIKRFMVVWCSQCVRK
jgi:hypothetical protein